MERKKKVANSMKFSQEKSVHSIYLISDLHVALYLVALFSSLNMQMIIKACIKKYFAIEKTHIYILIYMFLSVYNPFN